MKPALLRARALFASVGLAAAAASAQPIYYEITGLGLDSASGINAAGQVIGTRVFFSDSSSGRLSWQASRWTPGVGLEDVVSSRPGMGDTTGDALNDAGDIVGYQQCCGHAFRWSASTGHVATLGAPPGDFGTSAYDINSAGQAVGTTWGGQVVIWDASGVPQVLAGAGTVNAINDRGQVVGGNESGAFVWSASEGFVTIGTGVATDINERGDVVGYADDGRAFLWTAQGGLQPLAASFAGSVWPEAINDAGVVVGRTASFGFVWTSEGGLRDLNTLLDPAQGGQRPIIDAVDINNAGQIVANAPARGFLDPRGLLLNPVPEPGTLLLMTLGAALLSRRVAAGFRA